ncbi:hypothetical protein O181_075678 [Austropuccinia psidii MF-1]|uniref:Uncharacterized protein n=1 Tax=Austropuccinia psidii MF-1 TaxID=1389203 RepID=A0A9Q3FDH2_9BASI|nr:hypothetical protein [Austropuccinia psidii MF-1]
MSSSWDITVPLTATSHRCAMGVSHVIQVKFIKHTLSEKVLEDSGASIHLTGASVFASNSGTITPFTILLADPGSSIEISQTVKLDLPVPGGKLLITYVPFTPCVTGTIVSVGKLFHTGMIPVYKGGNLFFYLPT